MRPGQIALFHFDYKSKVMCGADGASTPVTPSLFSTLADAEAYASAYIETNPSRGCRLYDSSGVLIGDFASETARAAYNPRRDAKRDLCIGLVGLVLIPLGFLVDRWVGWGLFLGAALGTKFTMLGIMKLSEGIGGLIQTRRR
jgi:hypothetical protein